MIEIRSVPPALLDAVWANFRVYVELGLQRAQGDTITEAQMHEAIGRGDLELWCVVELLPGREPQEQLLAIVAISIEQYPNKRTLHVHMAAGREIHRWLGDVVRHLEEYRALTGCDSLEAVCRPGMARLLTRNGWRPKATIMQFESPENPR